jgi:hypothetical protein
MATNRDGVAIARREGARSQRASGVAAASRALVPLIVGSHAFEPRRVGRVLRRAVVYHAASHRGLSLFPHGATVRTRWLSDQRRKRTKTFGAGLRANSLTVKNERRPRPVAFLKLLLALRCLGRLGEFLAPGHWSLAPKGARLSTLGVWWRSLSDELNRAKILSDGRRRCQPFAGG